jgi:hypothetical protein
MVSWVRIRKLLILNINDFTYTIDILKERPLWIYMVDGEERWYKVGNTWKKTSKLMIDEEDLWYLEGNTWKKTSKFVGPWRYREDGVDEISEPLKDQIGIIIFFLTTLLILVMMLSMLNFHIIIDIFIVFIITFLVLFGLVGSLGWSVKRGEISIQMRKAGFTNRKKYGEYTIKEVKKKRKAAVDRRIALRMKRIAEEELAEKKRIEEEELAEKKRIEEEELAEKKRIAEEVLAEKKRIAEEVLAEKKRIAVRKERRAKLVEKCKKRGLAESGTDGVLKARINEHDKKKREAENKRWIAIEKKRIAAMEAARLEKERRENNYKISAFKKKNYQSEHRMPTNTQKEKTWIENEGKCSICNKNNSSKRHHPKHRETLSFWWVIAPKLEVILLCESCVIELDISENKPNYNSNRTITKEVRDSVWRRDEGKCTQCGSNKKLELDHIIPYSKGGSNSYRNIQLLCEECNRIKSDSIG